DASVAPRRGRAGPAPGDPRSGRRAGVEGGDAAATRLRRRGVREGGGGALRAAREGLDGGGCGAPGPARQAKSRGRRDRQRARPRRGARAPLVGVQGGLSVGARPALHRDPAARAPRGEVLGRLWWLTTLRTSSTRSSGWGWR